MTKFAERTDDNSQIIGLLMGVCALLEVMVENSRLEGQSIEDVHEAVGKKVAEMLDCLED